ncbi:MAG: glycosyltransferase family 2 protein [Actinomycetota bacterium]
MSALAIPSLAGRLAVPFDIVIPTIGRPSLAELLRTLADDRTPVHRAIVVDDRRDRTQPLAIADVPFPVTVVEGRAVGPAAARNAGWHASDCGWIAFLDDDVRVPRGWSNALLHDLAEVPPTVAGSQGRISVPLPSHRPPTDWERNVRGLETARWATADMAYRRSALDEVGGFDERFPRAYREDADLALRIRDRGWELRLGRRRIVHPVRPAGSWTSVRLQAGNADDARMLALHGRRWRERADAPRGTLSRHVATTAAFAGGLIALAAGRRRLGAIALTAWLASTAAFAWKRIEPGPRTSGEVRAMAISSVAIPPAATAWWLRGRLG